MKPTKLIWHSFAFERPASDSVFLVRGEMENNGHTSEYYVFIEENGRYCTAETGKDVRTLPNFQGYTFTHWAYIEGPKWL